MGSRSTGDPYFASGRELARIGTPLVQMPGSHEVLFTDPKGLAQKLIEAGRD